VLGVTAVAGFDPDAVIDGVFETKEADGVTLVVPESDLDDVTDAAAGFVPDPERDLDTEAAVTPEAETEGEIPYEAREL